MKQSLRLAIIFALFVTGCAGQIINQTSQSNTGQQNNLELEELNYRFSVKYADVLASGMWTLTHDYQSKEKVDDVLRYLVDFLIALRTKDLEKIKETGGVKRFKDRFADLLKSEDGSIRGFAAIVLGIAGDASYTPSLVALVEERDKSFTQRFAYPPVTYRGNAATALGILGAKDYIPKIIPLLQSKNDYDRRGAISALTYLDAKEYAKNVVALLATKELQVADDVSPIYFLIETGTANNYKKELTDAMLGPFGSETAKAAIYAFVRLNSKDAAKDIAKLLTVRFRKGDAAKALALLDAKEYSQKIALLLDDESSLVRKDAALALGILKANEHSEKISKLLNAREDFVRYYAASSLFLMGAKSHYKKAIPIIENAHRSGAYLNDGDFHPLVLDRSRQIYSNFRQLLEQAKLQMN